MTRTSPLKSKTTVSSSTVKKYFSKKTPPKYWNRYAKNHYSDFADSPSPSHKNSPESFYEIPSSPAYSTSSMISFSPHDIRSPQSTHPSPYNTPIPETPAKLQEYNSPPYTQHNLSFELAFKPGFLRYFIVSIAYRFPSTDYCVPLGRILSYLDWWELSMLDLATVPDKYEDIRKCLSQVWYRDGFGDFEIPTPQSNPQFYHFAKTLPFFEPVRLLIPSYGLPICRYLAGIFNRVKDLLPSLPIATTPVNTLIDILFGLLHWPEYSGFIISKQVKLSLIHLREGIEADHKFRNALVTQRLWKFSYPFLTHRYLEYCLSECRQFN
jgi:hypothetical protein